MRELTHLTPNPAGAFPPLPERMPALPRPFPLPSALPLSSCRSVRCGCYLLNYTPSSHSCLVSYDGTLRVECHGHGHTASGDLYQRQRSLFPPRPGFPGFPLTPFLGPAPNPAAGIPIFPRNRYRYYLRVTQLLASFTRANSVTLGLEMWRFNSANGIWSNAGTVTALMTWTPAPAGYPSSSDYLTGDVKNSTGTVLGRLTMGWVTQYLRQATVEIDRVAASDVHATGHAMGLVHDTVDNGCMHTTDVMAASAPAGTPFPNNRQWSSASDDQQRLRHYPDVLVRSGGTACGSASTTTPPITPTDTTVTVHGLVLRVSPLMVAVPLGAPVRVHLELVNVTGERILAPATLSMKTDFLRGTVVDAAGSWRTFPPLLRCQEEHSLQALEPGKALTQSLTLLRGGQGALFPTPGVHRIIVEVCWEVHGAEYRVTGETSVMVTAAVDEAHAQAAQKVLSTPETLLILVLGGDDLPEGLEAIQTALHNPVLRPHFAYIEAKRLAVRFGQRPADLQAAAALLDNTTVMSAAEVKKAAMLTKTAQADRASTQSIATTLKHKVCSIPVSDDIKDLVGTL